MNRVARPASLVALVLLLVGCGVSAEKAPPPGEAGGAGGSSGGTGAAGAAGSPSAGGAGGSGGAPDLDTVKLWVEEVTLGPEFGGTGEVCSRWDGEVTLSVMQGSWSQASDLQELVPLLNQQLAGSSTSITVLADADSSATLQVFYAPLAGFDQIAADHGFSYVQGNWGYFYTFWDTGNRITEAYVLLASDVLGGNELRHFTFEEVTQSLGTANDSAIFDDSIFFADGAEGGDAQTLSELDRHLVSFLYTEVQPGAGKGELDAAFDAAW